MNRYLQKIWLIAFIIFTFLWHGCATHVISSKSQITGKTLTQKIPEKLYSTEIKLLNSDPNKLQFQLLRKYAVQKTAQELVKIEEVRKEPLAFKCTTGYFQQSPVAVILFCFFIPWAVLADVLALPVIVAGGSGPKCESGYSFERRSIDPSIKWQVDMDHLATEPVAGKAVRLSINSLEYRKTIQTNADGIFSFNLLKHLPETPQDIRIKCDINDDELQQPIHYDISKAQVDNYLKDYPRYPAVLQARATALKKHFALCEQGQVQITLYNRGRGSAMGVRIVAAENPIFKTRTVEVGAIEAGESKTVFMPFQVASLCEKKKYLLLETTEKFGHDANPLKIEVPLSAARPVISIDNLAFTDGRTGLANGNGNGKIENGETIEVELTVGNSGDLPARRVQVELNSKDGNISTKDSFAIAKIPVNQSRAARFALELPVCYEKNTLEISAKAKIQDACFAPAKFAQALPAQSTFPHLTPTFHVHDGDRPGTSGNRNSTIENGEQVALEIEVANDGGVLAQNTQVSVTSPLVGLDQKIIAMGDIPAGESTRSLLMVKVPRELKVFLLPFELSIKNDRQCRLTQKETVRLPVRFIRPHLDLNHKLVDLNNNGVFEQGETYRLLITVANTGELAADNVVLEIESANPDIVIPDWKQSIGSIPAHGMPQVIDTSVFIKAKCNPGKYDVTLKLSQDGFDSPQTRLDLAVVKQSGPLVVAAQTSSPDPKSIPMKSGLKDKGNILAQGPVIVISDPVNNSTVTTSRIEVVVSVVSNQGLRSLTIGEPDGAARGLRIQKVLGRKQVFKEYVSLKRGENKIQITATDIDGVAATEALKVTFAPDNRFYQEMYAVLVGLDLYRDRQIPKLKYAVEDARGLKEALIQYAGFKRKNIIEILNQNATREEILYQIKDNLRNKVGPDDSVLFFFAGHGDTIGENTEVGCLLAYNTIHDRLGSTGISIAEIEEASRVLKSRHNLFLLDSCFSGLAGFQRRANPSSIIPSTEVYTRKMMLKNGNQIITAGMKDEKVIESDTWRHSVFSYYLIKGIQGAADKDKNNIISSSELTAYLQPKVTSESNGRQTPQLRYLGEEGEYMFKLLVK